MPSLQVKNVPEETLDVLRRRAAASHQSLQEYMLEKLITEAARPTMDEVLDLIRTRETVEVTLDEITELVRAERDRR